MGIRFRAVFESIGDWHAPLLQAVDGEIHALGEHDSRAYHVMARKLQGEMGIVPRAHHLVQFLAGTDAYDADRLAGRDRLDKIEDANRRDLRNENLAPLHALEAPDHEINP